MKSAVIKRSIVIAGHKTSISLEDAFWRGLKEIAISRRATLSDLVASIDSGRALGNLSSAMVVRAPPLPAGAAERPCRGAAGRARDAGVAVGGAVSSAAGIACRTANGP